MKPLRINERIRAPQVRVIAEDGSQMGVMSANEALMLAREGGFDLVEVSPQASPPVCRILNFNKFKYDEQRRERTAKRKHHITKLKEAKFKPHIEQHDYEVKRNMIRRFILRGDQVKVTMMFRGRELAHTEIGRRVFEKLIDELQDVTKVERSPHLDGRFMTMVFGPDRDKIKKVEQRVAQLKKNQSKKTTKKAAPKISTEKTSS